MKPNFFIVGGTKCGTTNISYYLNEHPQVFISELNEPYYFCKFDVPNDFKRASMITNKEKYLKLFEKAKNHKAIGEASSVYLHCPHAASEIKKTFPDSKIVISIRNPIERAHSNYFSNKFMNFDKRSFTEIIDEHEMQIKNEEFFIYNILEPGFFSKHIQRFQKYFAKNKIKIIVFEDYIKNTVSTIESILSFLDIEEKIIFHKQPKGAYRIPNNSFSKAIIENSKIRSIATRIIPTVTRQKIGDKFLLKQTNKPSMSSEENERLKKIYENEVLEIEKLLNRKLPWKEFY